MIDKQSAPHRSFTLPLFVWLIAQLLALLLAAARIPIAAGLPRRIEQLALGEMLAVQIITSAMLFPFLLRDVISTVAIVMTSAPYLALAGILSATPPDTIAICWVYLALWLIGLSFWREAVSPPLRIPAVAVANLLALGVPICLYLHAEFTTGGWPRWLINLSPLTAALILATEPHWISALWIPIGIFLLAGVLLGAIRRQSAGGMNSQ